jgi:hypothetical protein
VPEGQDPPPGAETLQALGSDRQDLDVGGARVTAEVLEAHLVQLALPARLDGLVAHDLAGVVEPQGGRAVTQPTRRDLGEEAREVGPQGEHVPIAAHERVGLRGQRLACEHVGVVEEGRDDLLVVPALEDRYHGLFDEAAAPGFLAHEALHPGRDLREPVCSAHRAPASAVSAASVIASTGAVLPVHASNCPTACATSISTPSITTQPLLFAAARSGVSRGS